MKKKKIIIQKNYLEKIPVKNPLIRWNAEEDRVTLQIENTGWANRIAQKLLGRPKFSFIHLDELGSFVWPLIDGQSDIIKIGEAVKEHFGEKCEPLYERLAQFFRILESYKFISFENQK
ncbi:MAG: PqqD family protein [Acutalibacteraceae bacterium]|nr:PqqD family protein [Acutalibacteraceae bacterium]